MSYRQPRLTIGLPVYNGDRFLEKALDSILSQTFTDFELIISDNASTDKTQEICQAYAAKDHRIKYYRNQTNIGGHNNFNRVFELATGEYFKWMAHDDLCASTFLEKCLDILDRKTAVVLCYPKARLIDETGQVLDRDCEEKPLLTNSPKPQVRLRNLIIESFAKPHRCLQLYGVIRRSALEKTSLLGNYAGADKVLLVKVALLGEYYEVPEYLFFNRHHAQRASKALASPYLRASWLDPSIKQGKLVFPQWRVFFGYLNSVINTPLNNAEKLRCYVHLCTWLGKYRDAVVKELIKAAIWPVYFPLHRRSLVESKQG